MGREPLLKSNLGRPRLATVAQGAPVAFALGLGLAGCQPALGQQGPSGLGLFGFVLGPSEGDVANRVPQPNATPGPGGEGDDRPGAPTAQPTQPAPLPTVAPPASAGGGGGGGSAPTVRSEVRVLDPHGAPIEGARVRASGGRTGLSDAQGMVSLEGPVAQGFVKIEATGYATSLIFADGNAFSVHLRSDGGPSGPFNQVAVTLSGQVVGAPGPLTGGDVVYVDGGGSLVTQGAVKANGQFSVRITPQAPSPGRGSLMVLAESGLGQSLVALSEVQLNGLDQNLGPLSLSALGPSRNFNVSPLPAAFDGRVQALLKLSPPGEGSAILVHGVEATSGQLPSPPAALPTGWVASYEFQAHSLDGLSFGQHNLGALGPLAFKLLAPPEATEGPQGFAWAPVEGAQAYLAEARFNGGLLAWERLEAAPSVLPRGELPEGCARLSLSALAGSGGASALPRLIFGLGGKAFRVGAFEALSERQRSSRWHNL